MDSNNLGVGQQPNLAGIDYSELVLIHATPRKPTINERGNVEIFSAFQNAGGFDQKTDSAQVEGRKPLGVTTRPSVHFTLQDPVSDHAYGAFEGREFTVYSPLKSAIEANGAPETLLTSDTAFFAPYKPVELPGSVIVQVDMSSQLAPEQFAQVIDGGLLVAPQLTAANRNHAESLLALAEKNAPGLGASEMLGYAKNADEGALAAAEISKVLALNKLNAPTINKALGQVPESKIGFDGWASNEALSGFMEALPLPDSAKSTVVLGRHDGTSADKLNSHFRNSNTEGLVELSSDRNPAVAMFAKAVSESDLHKQMRAHEVLAELGTEKAKTVDDLGISSNAMGRAFFADNAKSYTSAKLGKVSEQELHNAVYDAKPAELLKVSDNLHSRGTDHAGDKALSDFLRTSKNWQFSPPPLPAQSSELPLSMPPLPDGRSAGPAAGKGVPPPMPNVDLVASPPLLNGTAGFYAGAGVPPPMPTTLASSAVMANKEFPNQKETQMKLGEIGAPRNTGDLGVGAVPEVGSVKVVILNGSRQIDQVVPGVGANGSAGWQTQEVLGENGLAKGIYQLGGATDASKKVHPQQFGGQVLHIDKQNVYQFGPNDGKGNSTIVKHDRKIFDQALEGKEAVVGQCYEVSYSRGVGKVKGELSQEEGAKLQNRKVNKM